MPATVTLSSTTLVESVGSSERQVKVASTSGLTPGIRLFCDNELMTVVSLGVSPWVNVLRGVDGTASTPHSTGDVVYLGRADQFYHADPVGDPPASIPVSPYINAANGTVWFAQGDSVPEGQNKRWWEKQTATRSIGPLGIYVTTYSPTSST